MKSAPITPRPAFLYARVSSDEQEKEGFSIPAQLKLLREHAAENGMAAEREFIDVETAKQSGRAGFGEMVSLLQKALKSSRTSGDSPVLLVEKTDRLYRNLRDWVTLDELMSSGLEIHLVKEGDVLSQGSHSSAKFMHGIKVLMAKNYIDNLSEETKKGLREKAEQGIWPLRPPVGYRRASSDSGKKGIEPCPENGPIILRLFEQYATGQHAIDEVADTAAAAGLTPPRSSKVPHRSWIHKILTNPIYQGDFLFKDKLYRGIHQPLVSRELWGKVQDVMKSRGARKPKRSKHNFAFAGLLTCGHCGCALVGEIQKGRYIYYRCSGAKGRCSEPYVREEKLEQLFSEIIASLSLPKELVEEIRRGLVESYDDERRYREEAIGKLQQEYSLLQRRVESMYLDKLDGRVDNLFFDEKAKQWRLDQARMLEEINRHQAADQRYMADGASLLAIVQRAGELFEKQSAREKRKLLRFVLSNSTWKNGTLTPVFRQPFDQIAVTAKSMTFGEVVKGEDGSTCLVKGG